MKIIKVSQLLPESEALVFVDHFKTEEFNSDTLATGIVQLFKSTSLNWDLLHVGVLYLIFDLNGNCYYLNLYSPNNATLLWQQKIHQQFIYNDAKPFFHIFKGDHLVFGINFTDIIEADEFRRKIQQDILKRINDSPHRKIKSIKGIKRMKFSWFAGCTNGETKPKQTQIDKRVDISGPSDFKHVTHVSTERIFGELENTEIVAEIRKALKFHMNISTEEMESPEIHDYVNWIACEIRKKKGKVFPSNNTVREHSRPPAISWSYQEEIQKLSVFEPTQNTSSFESPENNGNRHTLVNTIADVIASRHHAQNYSDTEDDFSSDDEWI